MHRITVEKLAPETLLSIFLLCEREWEPVQIWEHPGKRIDLGWITLSHVCHRWRVILLDSGRIWGNAVTAIGDEKIMKEIIRRSKQATIAMNFDRLEHNVVSPDAWIPVTSLLLRPEHFNRAHSIFLASQSTRSDALRPVLLRQIFHSQHDMLTTLSLFVPHGFTFEEFDAPNLTTLSVYSYALTSDEAPISLSVMAYLLSHSPRLKSLLLRRAINANTAHPGSKPVPRCGLSELWLWMLDDRTLLFLAPYLAVRSDAFVTIHIISPMYLASTHTLACTMLGDDCGVSWSLRFFEDEEDIFRDWPFLRQEYLAIQCTPSSASSSITYRVPLTGVTEGIDAFANSCIPPTVTSAIFGCHHEEMDDSEADEVGSDEDETLLHSPSRAAASSLIRRLTNIRSLEVSREFSLSLLEDVPIQCMLDSLSLTAVFNDALENLTCLWHFLYARRAVHPEGGRPLSVTLFGPISSDVASIDMHYIEAPTLHSISTLCDLTDKRWLASASQRDARDGPDLDLSIANVL